MQTDGQTNIQIYRQTDILYIYTNRHAVTQQEKEWHYRPIWVYENAGHFEYEGVGRLKPGFFQRVRQQFQARRFLNHLRKHTEPMIRLYQLKATVSKTTEMKWIVISLPTIERSCGQTRHHHFGQTVQLGDFFQHSHTIMASQKYQN